MSVTEYKQSVLSKLKDDFDRHVAKLGNKNDLTLGQHIDEMLDHISIDVLTLFEQNFDPIVDQY